MKEQIKLDIQLAAVQIAVLLDLTPNGNNSAEITHTTPPHVEANAAMNVQIKVITMLTDRCILIVVPTLATIKLDNVITIPPYKRTFLLPKYSIKNIPNILNTTLTAYVINEIICGLSIPAV